jgi:hypothetical protein
VRPVRALAVFALVISALATGIAAAPGAQAVGTGTLNIHVVDEHGAPMPGAIMVISTDGGFGTQYTAVSEVSAEVPPGAYGVLSLSPWGGIVCTGLDTCDYLAIATGVAHPDGSVVVTDGQVTTVKLAAAKPVTLPGSAGRVGTPLVLHLSPGLQNLFTYLGTGIGGGVYTPTTEWLRNGQPIVGADDMTYVPTSDDVGSKISGRLTYTGLAQAQFTQLTGQPVTPRTTRAIKVDRVPTSTFTRLLKTTITAGQQNVARVDATAKNMIVTGKATVSVGSWSATRALRNGRFSVRLPSLKPGTYKIVTTYAGTGVFQPSTAKARTLVVKKA